MAQPHDDLVRIIKDIQREGSLRSNWSPALQAAPQALSAMGTCLGTASNPDASAIDVSRGVWEDDGTTVQLPYQFLDTNLQHCSDLGQAAFREAERGMYKLHLKAQDLTRPHGTIHDIVRLLDEPEAARYELRGCMDGLQTSAQECRVQSQTISTKFSELRKFTELLKKATTDQKGITKNQTAANKEAISHAEKDIAMYENERDNLKEQIGKQQELVDQARTELRSAQDAVDRANEKTVDDTQLSAQGISDIVDSCNRGATVNGKPSWLETVWGKSQHQLRMEQQREDKRDRAKTKQVDELLDKRNKQINTAREDALKALEAKSFIARERQAQLDATLKRYRENVDSHLSSQKSLLSAEHMKKLLAEEKLDLAKAGAIIETSLDSLTEFQKHIADMCSFFDENAAQVEEITSSSGPLGMFLKKIESASRASGNAAGAVVIQNFGMRDSSKKVCLENALMLQGRFSLVNDIAALYVKVSKEFITPGIQKMQRLGVLKGEALRQGRNDFIDFCTDAEQQISELARQKRDTMDREMENKVVVLSNRCGYAMRYN